MVSKILKFVKEHKLLFILSLGLTIDFSIDVNVGCNIKFDFEFKTLLFVCIGYQIIQQIIKVLAKKHNTR